MANSNELIKALQRLKEKEWVDLTHTFLWNKLIKSTRYSYFPSSDIFNVSLLIFSFAQPWVLTL